MSTTFPKPCRTRPLGVRACALVAMLVGLMAFPPAAEAAGWSTQEPPNPRGSNDTGLIGVSCTSKAFCMAVGNDSSTPIDRPVTERWNGRSWSITAFPPVAGAGLSAVSCAARTFCEAVGSYESDSGPHVLTAAWNGRTWSLQGTPIAAPAGDLSGVSCTSRTFCQAVGDIVDLTPGGSGAQTPLAERWNGAAWVVTPLPRITVNPGDSANLLAVSCASPRSCLGVGEDGAGPSDRSSPSSALAASWNGGRWASRSVPPPTNFFSRTEFDAVSCPAIASCHAVGTLVFGSGPFAEFYNGSRFALRAVANPELASNDGVRGISCASTSFCWAVGSGLDPAAPAWFYGGGRSWQTAFLPSPTTSRGLALAAGVDAISCPSRNFCEAVGSFAPRPRVYAAFAEQYHFDLPRPCCFGFRPTFFGLSNAGGSKRVATVTAVLRKRSELVLLLQRLDGRRDEVRLGVHPAGQSQIHWNLRVGGRPLANGRYQVSLYSSVGAVLSPAAPPGPRTLIVRANGHVGLVRMARAR
jgi:hypothetical protein